MTDLICRRLCYLVEETERRGSLWETDYDGAGFGEADYDNTGYFLMFNKKFYRNLKFLLKNALQLYRNKV